MKKDKRYYDIDVLKVFNEDQILYIKNRRRIIMKKDNLIFQWFIDNGFEITIYKDYINMAYNEWSYRQLNIDIHNYMYYEVLYYKLDSDKNIISQENYLMNYTLHKEITKLIEGLIKLNYFEFEDHVWK